jgi:hypothetical protein
VAREAVANVAQSQSFLEDLDRVNGYGAKVPEALVRLATDRSPSQDVASAELRD